MKHIFLGCFVALCVGFVAGCGGSTENTVIEAGSVDQAAVDAADEDYEAQMSEEEATPDE